MKKGKLIVIDGLDGCGKSTQLEIIQKKLLEMGYKIKTISFPDYNNDSSALVKMYLNGEFSQNPNDVNAYAASSFYAVDRYASYMRFWKKEYEMGYIILAARYVSSNVIHQMSKLNEKEWDRYIEWLNDYEYSRLGLPEADRVIFLDMPVEVSQRLLTERYEGKEQKKDIHEAHMDYLEKCRKSAVYAAEKLSWTVIKCSENGVPVAADIISDEIIKSIKEII